jgi:uncharacterized membrane protein YsdA (DUF1294 family)/cold shock CspA family protein
VAESEVRQRGVVVKYSAERGYGFILPQGSDEDDASDVYFHIRHVVGQGPPRVGQQVSYRVRNGRQGQEAVDVQPGSVLTIPIWKYGAMGLGVTAIFLIGIGLWLGWPKTPGLWLGLWMLCASVATFVMFGFDKTRARVDGNRVPEAVLKGMSVAGGWPGGFAGMRFFHHKTLHQGFLSVYWPIYLLEVIALVALLLLF